MLFKLTTAIALVSFCAGAAGATLSVPSRMAARQQRKLAEAAERTGIPTLATGGSSRLLASQEKELAKACRDMENELDASCDCDFVGSSRIKLMCDLNDEHCDESGLCVCLNSEVWVSANGAVSSEVCFAHHGNTTDIDHPQFCSKATSSGTCEVSIGGTDCNSCEVCYEEPSGVSTNSIASFSRTVDRKQGVNIDCVNLDEELTTNGECLFDESAEDLYEEEQDLLIVNKNGCKNRSGSTAFFRASSALMLSVGSILMIAFM